MKALESAREKIRKLSARPLIFTLVLILVAAGASVVTDKTVQAIGVGNLVKANDEYLASSLKKSGVAFVTLSAIKAGVAIITGSTVGIEAVATANVEIGDAAQSIYDFIDISGCWPLSSMARIGVQTGLEEMQYSNRTPSEARRSRWGV